MTSDTDKATVKENVIHMFLCEAEMVFLKPARLYRFEVDEDCEKCKRLAAHAKGEVI